MAFEVGAVSCVRLVGGEGPRRQALCVGEVVAELHDQRVTLAMPALAARGVGTASLETTIDDLEGAPTAVGFVIALKRKLRDSVPESWEDDYMHFGSKLFGPAMLASGVAAAGGGYHASTEDAEVPPQPHAGAREPRPGEGVSVGAVSAGASLPGLERLIAQAARRLQQQTAQGGVAEEVGSSDSEAEAPPPPAQPARARRSARRRQLSDSESEARLLTGAPGRWCTIPGRLLGPSWAPPPWPHWGLQGAFSGASQGLRRPAGLPGGPGAAARGAQNGPEEGPGSHVPIGGPLAHTSWACLGAMLGRS
ncbi:unnamed protein product [Prorocentrum cordatum]|uniref:Uncharacterized protein n=1 Tax=Prorocentrum cordatum TaxID=2364126 RepID=A0ABN9PLD5_9DINO|nr:unnamed protein product [Polarella glacialis]